MVNDLVVGVIATLLASGILYALRRQIKEQLSALNLSPGVVLIFVIVTVNIVFPLIEIEIPTALNLLLFFLIFAGIDNLFKR